MANLRDKLKDIERWLDGLVDLSFFSCENSCLVMSSQAWEEAANACCERIACCIHQARLGFGWF